MASVSVGQGICPRNSRDGPCSAPTQRTQHDLNFAQLPSGGHELACARQSPTSNQCATSQHRQQPSGWRFRKGRRSRAAPWVAAPSDGLRALALPP